MWNLESPHRKFEETYETQWMRRFMDKDVQYRYTTQGNYVSRNNAEYITVDPYYDTNVKLLIHANSNISDSSTLNSMLSIRNDGGTLPTISTNVSKFGAGSVRIVRNSKTAYLTPATSNYYLDGDFTFEFWINPIDLLNVAFTGRLFAYTLSRFSVSGGWAIVQLNNGRFNLYGKPGLILSSTDAAPSGTWTHIAVCRSGNTYSFFINGNVAGSVVNTGTFCDPGGYITLFGIGYASDSTTFNGYIDEVRLTKGVCRYTSNFTTPTSAFPNSVLNNTPQFYVYSFSVTSTSTSMTVNGNINYDGEFILFYNNINTVGASNILGSITKDQLNTTKTFSGLTLTQNVTYYIYLTYNDSVLSTTTTTF